MAEDGEVSKTSEPPLKTMFDRWNSTRRDQKPPSHWISDADEQTSAKSDNEKDGIDREVATLSAQRFAQSEAEIIAEIKKRELEPYIPTMEEAYLDAAKNVRIRKFIGKEAGAGIKIIAKNQEELLDSKGKGGGEVILHEWPDNDTPARLGVNSVNHLVVAVHSDEKTRSQYEDLVRTDPRSAQFAQTDYYFDDEGNIVKLASLPIQIVDDREPVIVNPGYTPSTARAVVSEMIPVDFEIVDAALSVLKNNLGMPSSVKTETDSSSVH